MIFEELCRWNQRYAEPLRNSFSRTPTTAIPACGCGIYED